MNERWSKLMVALHWVSAGLLAGLLIVGSTMVDLAPDSPVRPVLGRLHAVGGVTLALLTLARLLRKQLGTRPAPLPLAPLHRAGVGLVQALIYVAIFGMGASGLGTALGSDWHSYLDGTPLSAPDLSHLLSRKVHGALAWGLVLLVGAHVVGVVVQQVRKGGVLRRMIPFLR